MTPTGKAPWEIMPQLRADLLSRVRKVAWDAQVRVAARIDWKHGEDLWVAGCAAYKQRVRAFTIAASAEYQDWLWAGFIKNQFAVRLLGVPIRMYRPPEDGEVPEKYAHASEEELFISNGAYLLFDLPPSDRVWRLEVNTTPKAYPIDIVLVQVDSHGRRFNPYTIPEPIEVVRDADVDTSAGTTKPRKAPVILPEADVEPRKERPAKPDDLEAGSSGA